MLNVGLACGQKHKNEKLTDNRYVQGSVRSECSCEELMKAGMLECSSEYARASFWHRKCDGKSTEQTETIKQSGQTAESESEQHARR